MVEINTDFERVVHTADIVAAYVSNNHMVVSDLPGFIQLVHQSLCRLEQGSHFPHRPRGEPAVSIEDSVTPDYIVCLEDGKRMKMLKRHLKSAYNMTPEQYRERWNLPADYPVIAPNYAKRRSSIAREIGLGTHKKEKKKKAA